mgnify:CR=1 FL=1
MRGLTSLLFAILFFGCQTQNNTFTFTAIPDQDTARLEERFGKIAKYLTNELGVEVKYIPVKSYSASVEAFKNNQVQLAWFGGLSGVKARLSVPGSKAIAQGKNDPYFHSYFIANSSIDLKFTDEFPNKIKGKTFTFGSKGSTSGRLMPEFYLRENFKGNIEKEYLMTFYQKTSDTGNKEDNHIIINNKKHEWYFFNQEEKCTKPCKVEWLT